MYFGVFFQIDVINASGNLRNRDFPFLFKEFPGNQLSEIVNFAISDYQFAFCYLFLFHFLGDIPKIDRIKNN